MYICRGNGARTKNSKIMARQKGVIQYRGKLGQTVGMKNGFGGSQNFTREYVNEISNPQTDLQIALRVRMLPAVLFRRQLNTLISRAWQGVKYGGPSTRMFMKYAMREPLERVPQLVKDSTLAIPGEYLIAKGSLNEVTAAYDDTINAFVTSLELNAEVTNVAMFSQNALAKSYAAEGDQMTFIFAVAPTGWTGTPPKIDYSYYSLIIDPNSTEDFDFPMGVEWDMTSNGYMKFNGDGAIVLGMGVVVSRNGNTSNERSTARFAVDKGSLANYFGSTLKADVKASYQRSKSNRTLNWEYDEEVQGGGAREQADGTYTLTGLTGNLASLNGQPAKVKRYVDNGNLSAVYARANNDDRLVVGPDNNPYSVEDPTTHILTWLEVSDVAAFSGLPLILVD